MQIENPICTDITISNNSNRNYCVYENGASNGKEDEFSAAMNNNPISDEMNSKLHKEDLSTNKRLQFFYSEYVEIWKEEMSFSIENLNLYLDDEEKRLFEMSQSEWEKSLTQNMNFDSSIINNNKNILESIGNQYLYSIQIYLIEQYMNRDFHIKYLTFLIENSMDSEIKETNKTWCMFKLK